MPAVIINLPPLPIQNLPSVGTIALLRARPSGGLSEGDNLAVDAAATAGDQGGGVFAWVSGSTADDNGNTIIKPNDKGPLQAGRWVAIGLAGFSGPNGSASVGFQQIGTSSVARTSRDKMLEAPRSPEDFGAVGNGSANDATAIQAAIDAAAATATANRMGEVALVPGKRYKCNTSINVDISKVRFDGRGATLDFSAMTSGYGVNAFGTIYPPWDQPGRSLGNVCINGPGRAIDFVGLLVGNADESAGGPSDARFPSVMVTNCGTGIRFVARGYLVSFYDVDVHYCATAVHVPNAIDQGENLRFFGGQIYDHDLAFKLENPNAEVNAFGVSVDYGHNIATAQIAVITGGRLMLTGAHIEFGDMTQRQFVISGNGSSVIWSGGTRVVAAALPHSFDYWVDCTSPATYHEEGVFASNDRTSTGAFATGTGSVSRGWLGSYDIHNSCYILHATRSRVIDPGFTNASVPDNIMIIPASEAGGVGYTVASRLTETGSGVGTALATDTGRLKWTKTGAGLSSWALLVPVREAGEVLAGKFTIAKTGSQTGTVFLSFTYVRTNPVHPDANKVQQIVPISGPDSLAMVWTSSAETKQIVFAPNANAYRAPAGAEYFALLFNGVSMGAGDLFITTPNLDRIL